MIKAIIFFLFAYGLKYLFGETKGISKRQNINVSQKKHKKLKFPTLMIEDNVDENLTNYTDYDYNINEEWESKTLYWSKFYKDGYIYSTKKDAYWRKK